MTLERLVDFMIRLLNNSESGLMAEQDKLDCISNNIVNSETEGYKSEGVSFKNLLSESFNRMGYPVSDRAGVNEPYTGTGVRSCEWTKNNKQGPLVQTGVSTDLALSGDGYFRVRMQNGTYGYTRDSNFQLDKNGNIVDSDGNYLDIEYNPQYQGVNLGKGKFSIKEDGTVFLTENNNTAQVGKINVYNAVGDDSMVAIGDSLFAPRNGVQMYQEQGTKVEQGFVEKSNVNLSTEMTDMIMTERIFEMDSKALQTTDEMWQMANNLSK